MISLNDGRMGVGDMQTGPSYMNEAYMSEVKTFTLVPYPDGDMEPAPAVEVVPQPLFHSIDYSWQQARYRCSNLWGVLAH